MKEELASVEIAWAKRQRAQAELRLASIILGRALRTARAAGHTDTALGDLMGISRQRVAQIREGRPR